MTNKAFISFSLCISLVQIKYNCLNHGSVPRDGYLGTSHL